MSISARRPYGRRRNAADSASSAVNLSDLVYFPLLVLVCSLIFAGCNLSRAATADDATAGGDAQLKLEALQAQATPAQAISSPPAAKPTLAPTPDRCSQNAPPLARRIEAEARIDYGERSAEVSQRIQFYNLEDLALSEIVLDVQPNQWDDTFALSALRVNGALADYALASNRLEIPLAAPLMAGCWLDIALDFQLRPQAIREGLRAYRGFLGFSPRQFNLSHFLPTVAARLAGEWRIHQPTGIGEQIVYEPADWRVQVTVADASESLQLAAPGTVTKQAEGHWLVELPASRDLALSLSEEYILAEREVAPGLVVAVYTFTDARINIGGAWLDGAAHLLDEAGKALRLFARDFGAYPYGRFVIVQGDFPDGMEFSGLVYVGSAWFYGFDGTHRNYLTLIAVHEIAHQWWYARVGSDSALTPWLDEALATYSEYLFIEAFYPADKNWWWTFRVANFLPQGYVDSAVYEFTTARAYVNAVYLRGVQMLHNLRDDIGDAAFLRLLTEYSLAGQGKIADPALFWDQMPAGKRHLADATRAEFLREPGEN